MRRKYAVLVGSFSGNETIFSIVIFFFVKRSEPMQASIHNGLNCTSHHPNGNGHHGNQQEHQWQHSSSNIQKISLPERASVTASTKANHQKCPDNKSINDNIHQIICHKLPHPHNNFINIAQHLNDAPHRHIDIAKMTAWSLCVKELNPRDYFIFTLLTHHVRLITLNATTRK